MIIGSYHIINIRKAGKVKSGPVTFGFGGPQNGHSGNGYIHPAYDCAAKPEKSLQKL
jgi:hypothetical protein